MPTGTKIAVIVLVVLLGAAGLYYAFVAPSASNPKSTAAKESGIPSAGSPALTPGRTDGLSSPSALTQAPVVPSIGTQPSSASSTPAVGALANPNGYPSGTPATAPGMTATAARPGSASPSPTGLPAGTGTGASRPQPGFAPGSLGTAGTGKGDLPGAPLGAPVAPGARPQPSPVTPGGTVNGFPASSAPQVGATPANGVATPAGPVTTPTGGLDPNGPRPTGGTTATSGSGASTSPVARGADADGEKTHVVASGDTFSSIAKKYLGSEKAWKAIAKANPTVDPSLLKVGTKLRIPSSATASAASAGTTAGSTKVNAGSSAGGQSSTGDTHVVGSGDTLASIARKYYGNTKYWEKLYAANRDVIGGDPAALKVGQKLKLPTKTTVVGAENTTR